MRPGRGHVVSIVLVLALVAASLSGFVLWGLRPLLGLDLVGGVSVILTAPEGTRSDVLDRTLETIRNRVDRLGVAEPDITRQGDLNIQVQIPRFGGQSQERLLELVGKTARLEFREVLAVIPPDDPEYADTEVTREARPQGEVVYPEADTPQGQDPVLYRMGEALATGEILSQARAAYTDPSVAAPGEEPGWRVDFQMTSEGSRRFGEITEQLQGKQMAIVLDELVESAPTVQTQITGQGQITGNFDEQEARDLALVLETGALPVELEQSQVETVSPTLGAESLRAGLVAGVAGLIALALYLVFYYRVLGFVTWFGMATWGLLALTLVSLLGRTVGYSLTLSGIAGLVVAIGIAADSNIVFYERLKDELRAGKTFRSAVHPAFKRAWRTIVAADIVTISAAVVLYLLAIGAVKGFALTLGLATLLDMFIMYFFMIPLVFLLSRAGWIGGASGRGLLPRPVVRAEPQPVAGGSR